MTNTEVGLPSCLDGDAACDRNPRMAALLAVHLVSQVLDEAYVIANAARDSGEPWRYLSMLKSFKPSKGETEDQSNIEDNMSFKASKGDCDQNKNKTDVIADIVATSTPQKLVPRVSGSGEVEKSHDTHYIGQGDEYLDMQQNELATSTFINHLFDMSDVERVVICNDTQIVQDTSEPNSLINQAMDKIMASCDGQNYIPLENFNLIPNVNINDEHIADLSKSDHSDYSLLADAFAPDISRDVAFYIDDDKPYLTNEMVGRYRSPVVEELRENDAKGRHCHQRVDMDTQEMIQKNVALYEHAYATLNRDFDQGSDDGFPVLQDPKEMVMQEVELMTADTSDDNLSYPGFEHRKSETDKNTTPKKIKEMTAVTSTASCSRKSTLARRCRLQGARLLSCFRGWWRRRAPEPSKESRGSRKVRDMCPLSPDARRRASSLLDNRMRRSPSPSRPVPWKFNTVNEAVVNSNRWKEYTFDVEPEGSGEY